MINIAAYCQISLAMCTIFIEPMLACNRYFSIFYPILHKKVYKIGNIIAMCVLVSVLGSLAPLPHALAGTLGRVPGFVCAYILSRGTVLITVVGLYMPALGVMAIVMYFNFRIYRFLRQHQTQRLTNSQRTKLQNDREMLRFIAVTAVLPFIFETPLLTATWIGIFLPVSGWIIFSFNALFLSIYLANPLVTLFMIKPLRNRFLQIAEGLLGKNMVSPIVVVSGVKAVCSEPCALSNAKGGSISAHKN